MKTLNKKIFLTLIITISILLPTSTFSQKNADQIKDGNIDINKLTWKYGDTLDSLKRKNPNVRFNLSEADKVARSRGELSGMRSQYEVIEDQNPTTTKTLFTFNERGLLESIIWEKEGGILFF